MMMLPLQSPKGTLSCRDRCKVGERFSVFVEVTRCESLQYEIHQYRMRSEISRCQFTSAFSPRQAKGELGDASLSYPALWLAGRNRAIVLDERICRHFTLQMLAREAGYVARSRDDVSGSPLEEKYLSARGKRAGFPFHQPLELASPTFTKTQPTLYNMIPTAADRAPSHPVR